MAWQQKYKADDLIEEWKFEKFDRFHLWLRSYRFVQLHNEELKIATQFYLSQIATQVHVLTKHVLD